MSLLSTLAKVAVGIAVAKGVQGMTGKRGAGATRGAGRGSIFGDLMSPGGAAGGALGGLGSMLAGRTGSGSGLGGLLESLQGPRAPAAPQGSLQGVAAPGSGSLGALLNQSLDRFGEPDTTPTPDQEDAARVMLRAMLQAAKSDGRIDADEKKSLMGQLDDVSADEMAFINEELARPVDVAGLARDVPDGMQAQVYSMSLLAIDVDNKAEANYLNQLARALNIDPQQANDIHDKMGEPRLYS